MAIELTASVGYDYGEKCAVNHFETHVIVPASTTHNTNSHRAREAAF